MIKVGLVKSPNISSHVRGGGFYADRLLKSLSQTPDINVNFVDYSINPAVYRKYDLIHFTYFDFFNLTLPPVRPVKTVVAVHDMTPLKFPQHFPLGKKAKVVWPIQKTILKNVDAITTLSEVSKKDIVELTGIPSEKIKVIYLAADPEFKKIKDIKLLKKIGEKYSLPDKFMLYVGGVNWNKNLPALIKACRQINVNLVLVGKEFLNKDVDFSHAELQPFKEVLGLIESDQRTHRLGFVPTGDLAAIYNLATIYVQPSVYEGFGLPVLEAMSCGTPVICGRKSSLGEIGGEAAIYADVENSADIAAKIDRTLKLPRTAYDKIGTESIRQARNFSWEKTARETLEMYQKVLSV